MRLTCALLVLAACATVEQPPGGPPDFAPPALVSVVPDSGSVLTDLGTPAIFRFNEVIDERPGVTLDQLIIVSPRAPDDRLSVAWKRDAIEVRPKGGWRAGVPYRLSLLPGAMDLRRNRLTSGRTVLFSTGGPIPATRAAGRAIDWEASGAAARALVALTRTSDSLAFWTLADSTGAYEILAAPSGTYVLSSTIDRNANRVRDYREAYDSAVVTLDSTLEVNLWAFIHDTAGPRIRSAQRADSLAIRLEFTQPLALPGPPVESFRVRLLPDSAPVSITAVETAAAFDSARARRSAPAPPVPGDSVRAAPLPAGPPPTVGVVPAAPGGAPQRPGADSVLTALLRTRPRLTATWIVIVAEPLRAASRYVITAAVSNMSGAQGESVSVLVLPADPPPRDTTRRDTTRVRP
jgi:hypothetical protein